MKPTKHRDPLSAWHQLAAGSMAAKMKNNLHRKKRKGGEMLVRKVVQK